MPSSIRTPLNAGLVLLLLVVAGGFAVSADIGAVADRNLLRAVAFREGQSPGALIVAMQWITWAGDAAQRSLVMVGFAAWLFWKRRPRGALVMLVMPSLAGATSSMLKEAFARARPELVPHLDNFSNLSYPSGHAASAMAILLAAALIVPEKTRGLWIAAALMVATVIGFSRNLLGVHWPSDVAAGLTWGAGMALIALAFARRLEG
jgi:undecaprenyl-diphosphatase